MSTKVREIKLSELPQGQKAILKHFEEDAFYLQMLGMGCLPGEPIEIIRTAPFGNPIAFEIQGCNISIRMEDAEKITVETIVSH